MPFRLRKIGLSLKEWFSILKKRLLAQGAYSLILRWPIILLALRFRNGLKMKKKLRNMTWLRKIHGCVYVEILKWITSRMIWLWMYKMYRKWCIMTVKISCLKVRNGLNFTRIPICQLWMPYQKSKIWLRQLRSGGIKQLRLLTTAMCRVFLMVIKLLKKPRFSWFMAWKPILLKIVCPLLTMK